MLIKNQFIKMKWSTSNKKYFINKLYSYTKIGDEFLVKAEDLMPQCKAKVNVICDYCGKTYNTCFSIYHKGILQNGLNACSKCAPLKTNSINLNKRKQDNYIRAKEICESNGYKFLSSIDDCTTVKNTVQFECSRHGSQNIILDNLIRGHLCYKCGREATKLSLRRSNNEVLKIIEGKNNNRLLNPEDYIDTFTNNLKVVCGSCGHTFIQSLSSYKANLTGKCHNCNEISYGEYLISNFLDRYDIEYVRGYKFEDCKDKRCLPFDFYLPKYNKLIEFDGLQHYKPVWGEESFMIGKLHDAMKDWYCRWNNIELLRIPYWKSSDIEEILVDYLNLSPRVSVGAIKIKYISNKNTA